MARCRAGDCEVECGGNKGCGCIAESDDPFNCACFCFGESPSKNLNIGLSTIVDVSIGDLPLYEVAEFFNRVHRATVIAPAGNLRETVSLDVRRQSFAAVLNQLGLTTKERTDRDRLKTGLLMFMAGVVTTALIFGAAEKRWK